jgi:hypothetical protein
MTTPPDLSPDAQAVLEAQAKARCLSEWSNVNDPPCHPSDSTGWNGCSVCVDRAGAAAAIRAAADRVVPENPVTCEAYTNEAIRLSLQGARSKFLAIAAELDGTTPTTQEVS